MESAASFWSRTAEAGLLAPPPRLSLDLDLLLLCSLAGRAEKEAVYGCLSETFSELRRYALPLRVRGGGSPAGTPTRPPALSSLNVDWVTAGALSVALAAWSPAATASPLRAYGSGRTQLRSNLLHCILLVGLQRQPAFVAAASARLPELSGEALHEALLRSPELFEPLLPSFAASLDPEQAAIRRAVSAHARYVSLLAGEAPPEVLADISPEALACAAAAHACLRAAAGCSGRCLQPHPPQCELVAAVARLSSGEGEGAAPPPVVGIARALDLAVELLELSASAALPLFELEVLLPRKAFAWRSALDAEQEQQGVRVTRALVRILALCGWTHQEPGAVLTSLEARARAAPHIDVLLRELGGVAAGGGGTCSPLPALELRGLGGALRACGAGEATSDAGAATVLAGLAALLLAARGSVDASDGDENGVVRVQCGGLAAALRGRCKGGAARGAALLSFREACETARVRRLGSREARVEADWGAL